MVRLGPRPIEPWLVLVCVLHLARSAPTSLHERANPAHRGRQLEAPRGSTGERPQPSSIRSDSRNYVDDAVPFEQLVAMLGEGAIASTTPVPYAEQQAEALLDSLDQSQSRQNSSPTPDATTRYDDDDEDAALLSRAERRRARLLGAETELDALSNSGDQAATTVGPQTSGSWPDNPGAGRASAPTSPRQRLAAIDEEYRQLAAQLERLARRRAQLLGPENEPNAPSETSGSVATGALPEEAGGESSTLSGGAGGAAATTPSIGSLEQLACTDEQFEQLLAKLKQEALESLDHPDNYVRDEDLQRVIEHIESRDTCPICFDEFAPNDETVEIKNCAHLFHHECLRLWYETFESNPDNLDSEWRRSGGTRRTCPYCTRDYPISEVKTRGSWQ